MEQRWSISEAPDNRECLTLVFLLSAPSSTITLMRNQGTRLLYKDEPSCITCNLSSTGQFGALGGILGLPDYACQYMAWTYSNSWTMIRSGNWVRKASSGRFQVAGSTNRRKPSFRSPQIMHGGRYRSRVGALCAPRTLSPDGTIR